MRIFRPVFLALLLLITAPAGAGATTIICEDRGLDVSDWVSKHLAEADVVLLGETISAQMPPPVRPTRSNDATPSAGSMSELIELIRQGTARPPDYTGYPWQSVTLEVLRIWKGPRFRVFSVKNAVMAGHYGQPLIEGAVYLVFAYRQEGRIYTISTRCGETQTEADAEQRILALDRLAAERAGETPEDQWDR